jgi:hypothetical protein
VKLAPVFPAPLGGHRKLKSRGGDRSASEMANGVCNLE